MSTVAVVGVIRCTTNLGCLTQWKANIGALVSCESNKLSVSLMRVAVAIGLFVRQIK